MALNVDRTRQYLKAFDFKSLFIEELGWNHYNSQIEVALDGNSFTLSGVAEKHGMAAFICSPLADGHVPNYALRLKIEKQTAKSVHEHIIIYVDTAKTTQVWQWVKREAGRPSACREHPYHINQPGDSLMQKLQALAFSLEEEETLTIVEVAGRARAAFDIERVTKAFYRDFDTHRKAFLKFIDGISEVADSEWYASVMLNRLMFVYFIQRKGFLDSDHDYLRNRLDRCKKEQGKDKFYNFYRYFLLRLFHEGFGKRRKDRAPDLEKLLGNIPYLNGGLFDVHELEKPERYGKDIQIPDKAFERIFDYFDQYQWHLDERPLRKDDEINPDVLGYIFEKYINQKQMGAFYTKEDITEYISKSTVIPFLFDAARAKCKVAFENPGGPTVWDLLCENPDRYIYPAVRHGADKKLPPEIATGLDTDKPNLIERRKAWNKPAPGDYALPTEIWREVVARRQRYEEVRKKLATGEVREVSDFITLNLDLRQFAQDLIQNCEGPDLLMALWHAITTITVLDPTGGSGAFIFAALNVLEPLYEACLDRMEAFLAEWGEQGRKAHPNYHKKFTEVLARVDAHSNRRYFVLKSIILNNLYAVDIMEEAVEICKLRLFLKLAAQVEPDATKDNLGIEPLPDIDFNIRAGNTLVGFATFDELKQALQSDLLSLQSLPAIEKKAEDVDRLFKLFHQQQTELGGEVTGGDKQGLRRRLKILEDELNSHLANEYGVDPKKKTAYEKWLRSHQPFHWFIEFYGILKNGGFDVIIGNPPYVDFKDLKEYVVKGYKTSKTRNLYSLILERCQSLVSDKSRQGYIVPVSSIATEGYLELQETLRHRAIVFSSFDDRPAHLFDGLDKNTLSILLLAQKVIEFNSHSTRLSRWGAEERPNLFPLLKYNLTPSTELKGCWPKIGSLIEGNIWNKLFRTNKPLSIFYVEESSFVTYYSRKVNAFLQILNFVPAVRDGKGHVRPPSEFKNLSFSSKKEAEAVFCCFNSTLFRWFMDVVSDGSHVNRREVDNFRFDPRKVVADFPEILNLAARLSSDLNGNSFSRTMRYKHDTLTVQCIIPKNSKSIIDEIDRVLAKYYGFTDEELDFIINYDIKYRMGRDNEEENS